MATILNAYDLKMGKKAESRVTNSLYQPIQMLPTSEKNDEWKRSNMDWFEQLGLRQINLQAKRLIKLKQLSDGIINKNDYIPNDKENDAYELIHNLTDGEETPYELKFYPIIPNVVNVLTGEFSKRTNKVVIYTVDDFSLNELLEEKRQMVEDYLVSKAKNKIAQKLADMGVPLESEQAEEAFNSIDGLPEIENFFKKSYKSIAEQWASKQLDYDLERFRLYEMENDNFKNYIDTGRTFFHLRLKETDYEPEIWSPINTFFHKSSAVKYISEGDYAGRILMMSISDVINRYGYLMTAKQTKGLEMLYNAYNTGLVADGQDLTAYYDTTKGPNEQGPNSVFYERLTSARNLWMDTHLSPDFYDPYYSSVSGATNYSYSHPLLRVTEIYWKSQRRLGHLTKVDEEGNVIQEIVTEDYKVTEKPIYDKSLLNIKTKENLVFGEHIDWVWVNEVWKGVKISPNYQTYWTDSTDSFSPIYLDVKPIKFQFKGINNLYDCRLPVEGIVDPTCPVQQMRPFQIQYNMVNNQIADIQVDELGTVILLDQNSLPRQSMGEEWGANNFQKAYQTMKDFSILPVDTSVLNTEVAMNFQHFQTLDLNQSKRLLTKVELANYFKAQAFETVGITMQRLGSIAASESATGVQQAVNNSYSQTEMYFTRFSNFLMPRFKEMMLNAAQFYNATKPSVQLSYITSDQERSLFNIEGYKLLLKDFNILVTSRPDHKNIVDQLKQLAINNNTTNSEMSDLAKIVAADTVSEIIGAANAATKRLQDQQMAQSQREQEMMQSQMQMQEQQDIRDKEFEASENAKDRELEIMKAQIQAMGYAKERDIDGNGVPDVLEVAEFNRNLAMDNQDLLLRQQEIQNKKSLEQDRLSLEREKMATERYKADRALDVAVTNKTEAELKAARTASKNKSKKK